MKPKNNILEFEMPQFLGISDIQEKLAFTARIICETMKCVDDLTDLEQLTTEEEESRCEGCENSSFETLSSLEIEKPISMMSDAELAGKISEIYLDKMRQVAETSGKLFVSAARVKIILTPNFSIN